MNQPQTQSRAYWVDNFVVTDGDIEQIYNHLLEAERPQTAEQIAEVIIGHRVAMERSRLKQLLTGRAIYQPMDDHQVGDEIVFPDALDNGETAASAVLTLDHVRLTRADRALFAGRKLEIPFARMHDHRAFEAEEGIGNSRMVMPGYALPRTDRQRPGRLHGQVARLAGPRGEHDVARAPALRPLEAHGAVVVVQSQRSVECHVENPQRREVRRELDVPVDDHAI